MWALHKKQQQQQKKKPLCEPSTVSVKFSPWHCWFVVPFVVAEMNLCWKDEWALAKLRDKQSLSILFCKERCLAIPSTST
jgi:hypothetical protein